jgi:hypothetical protein
MTVSSDRQDPNGGMRTLSAQKELTDLFKAGELFFVES